MPRDPDAFRLALFAETAADAEVADPETLGLTWEKGWTVVYGQHESGFTPELSVHNWLLRVITYMTLRFQRRGLVEWDEKVVYAKDAVVPVGPTCYISVVEDNVGNDPTTDADETYWRGLMNAS